jgi:hypothetical protein
MLINEVSMRPTDLKAKVALLSNALVGIEFELIVKNVSYEVGKNIESEADYSADEYVADSSWERLKEDIENFFRGEHNSYRHISRCLYRAKFDYDKFLKTLWNKYKIDNFDEWVTNNTDKTLSDLDINTQVDLLDQFENLFYDEITSDNEKNLKNWLDEYSLTKMSNWENEYSLNWPHWSDTEESEQFGTGNQSLKDIADSFERFIDTEVNYSNEYHDARRSLTAYSLEPDTSLQSKNSDDVGLEFISPPLPVNVAIEHLHKVKKWCIEEDYAYTNSSCGLHINVSFPNYNISKLDYVKLVLFLGDNYIANEFERLGTYYAQSSLNKLNQKVFNANYSNTDLFDNVIDNLKKSLYTEASKLIQKDNSGDKYVTVNIKNNRVEFRSPGGNWLNMNIDKITNTILRFVVALDIALDENKYKKEYASKLYKLISPNKISDTLALFSLYQSGGLSKSELKRKWSSMVLFNNNAAVKKKELAQKLANKKIWKVVENNSAKDIITHFEASSKEEAEKKAVKFIVDNNLHISWHIEPDY